MTAVWVGVQEALARYLDAVDSGDLEAVCAELAEARVVTPGGEFDGEAVRAAYRGLLVAPVDGRWQTKHHVISEPDEDGVVTARASYFVLGPGEEGPRVVKSGRFEDRLARVDSRWVIREHRVIADL